MVRNAMVAVGFVACAMAFSGATATAVESGATAAGNAAGGYHVVGGFTSLEQCNFNRAMYIFSSKPTPCYMKDGSVGAPRTWAFIAH